MSLRMKRKINVKSIILILLAGYFINSVVITISACISFYRFNISKTYDNYLQKHVDKKLFIDGNGYDRFSSLPLNEVEYRKVYVMPFFCLNDVFFNAKVWIFHAYLIKGIHDKTCTRGAGLAPAVLILKRYGFDWKINEYYLSP